MEILKNQKVKVLFNEKADFQDEKGNLVKMWKIFFVHNDAVKVTYRVNSEKMKEGTILDCDITLRPGKNTIKYSLKEIEDAKKTS